jgi:hypothetical protein
MTKFLNRVLVAALIVSLVLNGVIILKFNNVSEDVGRNYEKLNYLERSVNNMSSDLTRLASKQDWVSSKEYKILEIDKDYKNVKILIYGNLKELENNAKLYLLYGKVNKDDQEEIEWVKTSLNISYGLKFSKTLVLPYKENYKFKLLAEGPSKLRSEDLLYAFFKEELESRIYTHIFANNNSKDKESTTLDINIDNNFKGQDKLKIKNIKVNTYNDSGLYSTMDVYKEGKIIISDNIIDIPIKVDQDKEINEEETNIQRLNYNVKIKKDTKEKSKLRFEIVIEDYMGEQFKEEYSN